ncbi:zinc-dependent alcohol dehydrogenase [Demetria terragena]|uniref:zinc-dependent alcohol dehydrogenase n=1 Tax=Demetria terragena TaxID=63959 RepID=UPI0003811AB5|nr:alcohol dehydrogenase catalytic domain-containing protein [Demetria terragena]
MADIRRIVVDRHGEVVTEQATMPEPGPQEVRVRTVLVGVCGSDTHAQHGRHPHVPLPYAPGHEVLGIVDAVGEQVTDFSPGQRVTVEPTLPCWDCKQCRGGDENLCENLKFFGCGHEQGGMAQLFTIAARRLHHVPDELDDHTAALIEPLSTPVHAVRIAGPLEGRSVAIIGGGTIGLLTLAAARAAGARRVVLTDPLAAKRALAAELGADAVVDAAAPHATAQIRAALGESADVVFDCVAITPTVAQGVELARKGGTVAIVGVPTDDLVVPLPIVQDEQIRLQGSATYVAQDVRAAIELLQSGAVPADRIVTSERPEAEAAQAFRDAISGEQIKVVIRW